MERSADVRADFSDWLALREFGAVVLVDFTGSDPRHVAEALRACRASDGARPACSMRSSGATS